MKLGKTYFSGSLTFDEGNNFIGPNTSVLTGSLSGSVKGTFEGSFAGDTLTNISGAFDAVSASIASDRLKNTTDTLTGDLTVTGTLTAQDLHVQEITSSVLYSSGSNIFGNQSSDTHQFTGSLQVSGSTNYLLGSVGIGTTSPVQKLDVEAGHISVDAGYGLVWSGDADRIITPEDNTTGGLFKVASGAATRFMRASTESMRIDGNGNLGIGNSSPQQKLVVATATNGKGVEIAPGTLSYIQAYDRGTSAYSNLKIDALNIQFGTNNGTERMRIDSSGNVGIGSTTPTGSLDVTGTITSNTNFNLHSDGIGVIGKIGNTANDVNIFSTSAGHNGLRMHTNGILPTDNTGTIIDNDADLGDVNYRFKNLYMAGAAQIGDNVYMTAGQLYLGASGATTDDSHRVYSLSGAFQIESRESGTWTQRMTIDTSGNVGIGNTSPFSKLQIGNNTFSGGNGMYTNDRVGISNHGSLTGLMLASTYNDATYPEYGLVFVQGASTSSYNVWSISPDGPAKGDSLNFIYGSNATNIHTATPKVVFDGNGNVGIGINSPNLSSSGRALTVNSTATANAAVEISDGGTLAGLLWGRSGTGVNVWSIPSIPLGFGAANKERMRLNPSNETMTLTANTATGTNWIQFRNNAGTAQGYVGFGSSSSNNMYISQESSNVPIIFLNGGVERMRIESGGEVGIGTTSPQGGMHVKGNPIVVDDGYQNHQTMIYTSGQSGTYNGSFTFETPETGNGASSQGYGGYVCEIYISGYSGIYCHAIFSGYINVGITAGEATILRSSGGWSISQSVKSGTYQGLSFVLDYPNGLIHPCARIFFTKGGDNANAGYDFTNVTTTWS